MEDDIIDRDIIKEAFDDLEEYQKNRKEIELEIMNIFENKKVKPNIAYEIIKDLKERFELIYPAFIISQKLAEHLASKVPADKMNTMNDIINKELEKRRNKK